MIASDAAVDAASFPAVDRRHRGAGAAGGNAVNWRFVAIAVVITLSAIAIGILCPC